MLCNCRVLLRKSNCVQDWITPEQVVAFYHGNEEKARAAMVEAELENRIRLRHALGYDRCRVTRQEGRGISL